MNLGIIIVGSIVFAAIFIFLGYKIGVNTEKDFIKSIVDMIIKNREKAIKKLESEVLDYFEKWDNNKGNLSDEDFDNWKDKCDEMHDEMHEKFIMNNFKETVLK